MGKTITFWIFRHGYSCTNMDRIHKKRFIYLLSLALTGYTDPHLTNIGINTSKLAGEYIKKNINIPTKINKVYVSPLIRTWETLSCMFPNIKSAEIGSYLREGNFTPQKKEIIKNLSDKPYPYNKNIERFETFKNHVYNNTNHEKITTKIKYKSDKYDNSHTLQGNLDTFILWCAKRCKNKDNVLVVCHGQLIKNFIKKYNESLYKKIKSYFHNNNFGIKVKITYKNRYNKNTLDESLNTKNIDFFENINIQFIFKGIKNIKKYTYEINKNCSLCFKQKKCNEG